VADLSQTQGTATPQPSSLIHAREKHILEYEEFNLVVEITADGDVNVDFCDFGSSPLSISAKTLGEIAAFVEQHAQVRVMERDDD
jgi:hypothetical protein